MVPALLALVLGDVTAPGAIPHLAKGELVVLSSGGGEQGFRARLTVREDGTLVYTASLQEGPVGLVRSRLSPPELADLRRLIARTDFAALHRGARAPSAPSALDGIDRGFAVRHGTAVRGWSNTLWTESGTPIPLLTRLQALTQRLQGT